MRKILVVAAREYKAAVRTKTFLISLLIMPLMMVGSILLQWLLRDLVDTADKHFVLIDRANRRASGPSTGTAASAAKRTLFASSRTR